MQRVGITVDPGAAAVSFTLVRPQGHFVAQLVDAAPWIGLVNPSWVDVISPRLRNYVRNAFLGVLFDQMWVR